MTWYEILSWVAVVALAGLILKLLPRVGAGG